MINPKILSAVVVAMAGIVLCQAAITPDQLTETIKQRITGNVPDVDAVKLNNRAFNIATTALNGASDYKTLEANLETEFQKPEYNFLDWQNNSSYLKKAARQIAVIEYPPDTQMIKAAMDVAPDGVQALSLPVSDDNGTNVYGLAGFWTGAKLSNPYKITGNQLTSAGSSSDGYIEFNLSSRYVERKGANADGWSTQNAKDTPQLVPFWKYLPDFDYRIGYIFRGSSAPTNFVASTVVGAADFYSDFSMGVPLIRYQSSGNGVKGQLTLELNGGFATDKNQLSLHPNAFVGLGGQVCYPCPWGITNNGYLYLRAGGTLIDQPNLNIGTNTVVLNQLGEPSYHLIWTPSIGAIATIPLNSTISLQTSVNAYFTQSVPASWNATIGVSVAVDKLFGSLLGK